MKDTLANAKAKIACLQLQLDDAQSITKSYQAALEITERAINCALAGHAIVCAHSGDEYWTLRASLYADTYQRGRYFVVVQVAKVNDTNYTSAHVRTLTDANNFDKCLGFGKIGKDLLDLINARLAQHNFEKYGTFAPNNI